jgi:pilus assembly protein FimV
MGRQIDPENVLYQPGGHPEEIILDGERVVVEPLSATTMPHQMSELPPLADSPRRGGAPTQVPDLNLDLDLSDDTASQGLEATQPMAPGRGSPAAGASSPFADTATHAATTTLGGNGPDSRLSEERTVRAELDPMSLDLSGPDEPATVADRGAKSLDFGSFALSESAGQDGGPTTPSQLDALGGDDHDPLTRKLELAEEFRQIGDIEGARDLVSEVVAKSSGVVKARAQAMLDALG